MLARLCITTTLPHCAGACKHQHQQAWPQLCDEQRCSCSSCDPTNSMLNINCTQQHTAHLYSRHCTSLKAHVLSPVIDMFQLGSLSQ